MEVPTKPTLKPYRGQLPDHGNPATWVDRTTDFWTWETGDGYNNTAQTVTYAEGAMAYIAAALNGSADMAAFMARTDNPHGVTAAQLGDYEAGTWTPSLDGATGISYTAQTGHYVKVGELVAIFFKISFTGTVGGANIRIGGRPFAQATADSHINAGVLHHRSALVANPDSTLFPALFSSSSGIYVYNPAFDAANTPAAWRPGTISGQLTYRTA